MFQVVHELRSIPVNQTVAALERLLELAKAGHIIGLGYILLHQNRHMSVGLCGAAEEQPHIIHTGASKLARIIEEQF